MTLEFLCTLQITDTRVKFRLFGKVYYSPYKVVSLLLGFNSQCVVDVDHALQDGLGENNVGILGDVE